MTVCKKCGGTGEINVPVTEHMGTVLYGTEQCDECDGTGEEQTNEEWLDRKSTKEKAEWLFKLTYKCYWCGREYTPRSPSLFNEKECPFKKCMKDKKDFEKWLKEKHDEM